MLLAIDTATDRASVAVGTPEAVLVRETVVGSRRHAGAILPAVMACLEQAGGDLTALSGILLADGPGSFTGLRVGASVMKALVRVRPVPVRIGPSLLVTALGARSDDGEPVVAASDALRGDLFAACYRCEGRRVVTLLAPSVMEPGAVLSAVPATSRFTGPAAPKFGAPPTWPDAADLIRLAGLADGLVTVADPAAWEPIYGRPAEAQAKWEREHGRPLDGPASGPR